MILTACEAESRVEIIRANDVIFPTATPGSILRGELPAPQVRAGFSPAALPVMPTPTPATEVCPSPSETATLPARPDDPEAMIDAIIGYLSDGGSAGGLAMGLGDWEVLDTGGFVQDDVDLTGRGQPEIIISYSAENSGGILLILGCEGGAYVERYRAVGREPVAAEIIAINDMNLTGQLEVAFATQQCTLDRCEYRTQVITWESSVGRFVGLISGGIVSGNLPELVDTDDDQILEIVVRLTSLGDINTGPLRTGVKIYDWNGTEYVLSIALPDPVRYQIQVIHEADRYLTARRISDAVRLYQRALTDDDLRVWLRNEQENLESYVLYRLMIAYGYENSPAITQVYERMRATFDRPENPEPPPVYFELARVFWDAYFTAGDVSVACGAVRQAIDLEFGEAVTFLNRYGSRNPTYTIRDICPF